MEVGELFTQSHPLFDPRSDPRPYPMQVLCLDTFIDGSGGGAETSLYDIATKLAEKKIDLRLFYEGHSEILRLYEQARIPAVRMCDFDLRLTSRHAIADSAKALINLMHLRQITSAAPRRIIYCNTTRSAPIGLLMKRCLGGILAIHVRTCLVGGCSRIYSSAFARADVIIANSRRSAYFARAIAPAVRTEVVYNGIDLMRWKAADTPVRRQERSGLNLMFLGRISETKGLHVLLDAMPRLAKSCGARLWIAGNKVHGEEEYYGRVVRQCQQLNHIVEWLGYLTNPVDRIQASDMLVVPSVWEESFGKVIVEAMASGVAVVASRIGGIPEVIGDQLSEFLFTPGDASDLATTIERCDALMRRKDLGQVFRSRAELFDINATSLEVEKIFRSLAPTTKSRLGAQRGHDR